MTTKRQLRSKEDRAFSRGIRRIRLDDPDAKPKPPLDPVPEYEPHKKDFENSRFEAIVDPAIQLSKEAAVRIERQLRQAVLVEIANLEFLPEVHVSGMPRGRSRGIEVRLVRD